MWTSEDKHYFVFYDGPGDEKNNYKWNNYVAAFKSKARAQQEFLKLKDFLWEEAKFECMPGNEKDYFHYDVDSNQVYWCGHLAVWCSEVVWHD